jgi:hypothetical protein
MTCSLSLKDSPLRWILEEKEHQLLLLLLHFDRSERKDSYHGMEKGQNVQK